MISALQSMEKSQYEGPFGEIKITQREYYKMTDKEKTFQWLKERGEFEALATVNAQTFSGHAKKIIHQKREEENDFVWLPPGVEDSTSDYTKAKIVRRADG